MKKQKWYLLLLLLAVSLVLAACGGGNDNAEGGDGGDEAAEDNFSVAMVTDIGGVDDKSFNQSAWEGLQAFGEEYNLEKGDNGYDYLQSNSDADYIPNLNQLVRRNFDLIYGIGFMLKEPIMEVADQNPEVNFGLVDDVIEGKDNVVSIMFKEQEVSFLAGVAAAKETKTGKVGFVGGMESPVISRFEEGFKAGVKSVDPNIEIIVNYVGSFGDAAGGQQAANAIYSQGADIIFHASGATGNGVFAEAKERIQQNPDQPVWVIGVDSDQYEEGKVSDDVNVTLTSALKRVDVAVKEIAERAMNGDFPGGETITFGLADNGVELAETGGHIPQETWDVINEYKQKIIDGEITPPGTPEEYENFLKDLGIEE